MFSRTLASLLAAAAVLELARLGEQVDELLATLDAQQERNHETAAEILL